VEKEVRRRIGYDNKIAWKKQWDAKGSIGFGLHTWVTNTGAF